MVLFSTEKRSVVPAQAGIHPDNGTEVLLTMDPRLRGDDIIDVMVNSYPF